MDCSREMRTAQAWSRYSPFAVMIDVPMYVYVYIKLGYIEQFVWIGYYKFAWILEDQVQVSISATQSI